MIELKSRTDFKRLRRIALEAQGLLQVQVFGSGLSGAIKAINHLGYVQIDTISVVERAHNHVFHTRVPKFKPSMTNQMLLNGDIFEYWSHAAALLPIADFRFSLPYKQAIKSGQVHWYKNPDKKLMAKMLAHISSEGPLRSRDIKTDSINRSGWWDWKPAKKALEQLYMQGDLMVSSREGFQKSYDLTERVLPANVNSNMPSVEEFASHILDQQLGCHGIVSLKGITYLRRNTTLRKAVKKLVEERLAQQTLEQVQIENGNVFLLNKGALERPTPRLSKRMLILSPFDNSVIQRDRLKTLFNYNYQIECYVPESKRQFGYFSLPLLYGDEFVGRMDCKAHRKDHHLEIKSLHLEPLKFDNKTSQKSYLRQLFAAFKEAIPNFASLQQCDSVSITDVHPSYRAELNNIDSLLS